MKGKIRKSRISFCEWNSQSFGHYNTGGIICNNCNFHRSLMRGERQYCGSDNKMDKRKDKCPNCNDINWYYLPPIARVPRKLSSKSIWREFWDKLKNREFNHPSGCCR